MTAKTFDTNGLTFSPLTRPDRPPFAVDAPAIVEPTQRIDATPFANNTAIYDKIHKREKRPIAALVAGATIVLTGAVLFATSGHKRSTIGETPVGPTAAAAPVMATPPSPAPLTEVARAPASPAPVTPAPAARAVTQPTRAAPVRVAHAERTASVARTLAPTPTELTAPTPMVVAPAPVAVTPAPIVVAPPPVVVAPAPVQTPSDTPQ